MDTVDNSGIMTGEEDKNTEINNNKEKHGEKNNEGQVENKVTPKKKREHKKGIATINLDALRRLEGTTTSSFVDLARAVVLIDGVPYDEDILPMSKARKIDFERLIAHYAKLEIYGKRKYHVKSAVSRIPIEERSDVRLTIERKASYNKPKKLTEAEKEARRIIYKAKRENEKREQEKKDAEVLKKAQDKLNELAKEES